MSNANLPQGYPMESEFKTLETGTSTTLVAALDPSLAGEFADSVHDS